MKIKYLIISILVVLGTISACKNEKITPTPEQANPNLSKNGCVLSEIYGESFNKSSFFRPWRMKHADAQNKSQKITAQVLHEKYFYDEQGRVTKREIYDTDSTGAAILVFEEALIYSTGSLSVIFTQYAEQGNLYYKDTTTATTNSFGFIASINEKSPDGDEYSVVFEYNAEGYITKKTTKDVFTSVSNGISRSVTITAVELFEYTNGNLLKQTIKDTRTEDGQLISTTNYTATYEYGTQLMQPNFIKDKLPIAGKFDKNLVKKRTQELTNDNGPVSTDVTSYNYELDAKGNVTKRTTLNENSPEPIVESFVYTCK